MVGGGRERCVRRLVAFFVARIVIARVRELVIARIGRLFHALEKKKNSIKLERSVNQMIICA